jgi:F420-dependent oxidoreductase-like protein
MRLSLMVGFSGRHVDLPMESILEADRLGFHAVWTSEAWGSDAITPLAWIGAQTKNVRLGTAIMQMQARTPAMTAMTAITLDQLSGGRFLLGLGLSGPQVVEGWYGQPYSHPLARTREYVHILRQIFARQGRLHFDGEHYQIPYKGADSTGLGKPLKSMLHSRPDMPIYLAAIGPKNVALTAEIADGWLPIFFSPERYDEVFRPHVEAGLSAAGKSIESFDIAPTVHVTVSEDVEAALNRLKPMLALYIGGMGARGKNFYFDLVCRYGYEEAAHTIQELYLSGRQLDAMSAVPDSLVDEVALCGPRERIQERLARWQTVPVQTLNLVVDDLDSLRTMAELVL